MIQASLLQELRTGHTLMMQCAATAERLLGHDLPAGLPASHVRAQEEATRMAGLFARLGAGYEQVALLRARLPGAAPVPSRAEAKLAPTAPKPKLHAAPGVDRGRLRNGNPSGDFLKSPRCGACTRAGGCCRQPAMANGRCRMHGGLSTGPRTPEGLARCRVTRLVHGCRTRAHLALRSRAVHAARRLRALATGLSARVPAGHGVHRSKIANPRRGALRAPAFGRFTVSSQAQLRPIDPQARAARAYPNPRDYAASAGHGVHPPSRSPLQRAKEGRPESPGVTTPAGLR